MRPPPRNMHSASPGRKRKAAGRAGPHRPKRAPCSRPWAGARQRGGRISHKLFYFTERSHGGAAKRAAQAPQPGNKDVRHAQAAGLAARLYNASGELPPEREKASSRTPHWQRMTAQACTAGGKHKRAVLLFILYEQQRRCAAAGRKTRPHSLVLHMPGRAPRSRAEGGPAPPSSGKACGSAAKPAVCTPSF